MSNLPLYLRGKTVLLDIDGTLTAAGSEVLSHETIEAVAELVRHNRVFLFSNKGLPERNARVAERLGVPLVDSAHSKPDPRVVQGLALEGELVVVGDKVLTDGLLATFTGAKFIQVPRITAPDEPVPDRLFNAIDDIASLMGQYLMLMRPAQWVKNVLVFAPLFFAQHVSDAISFGAVTATFFAFCFLSSATYILNDYFDRAADREHPTKRYRPLASGKVAVSDAILLGVLLVASATTLLAVFAPAVFSVAIAYVLTSVVYSMYLKRVPVVEMLLFIWFYYARVIAGGVAAGVELSVWLTCAVAFLALFLVTAKRYAERSLGRDRGVLGYYSSRFLRSMLFVSVALTLVSYVLWGLFGVGSAAAIASTFAVFMALTRYMYLALRGVATEYPEKLVFKDRWLMVAFGLWAVCILAVFY